jgi:hypothetical protein
MARKSKTQQLIEGTAGQHWRCPSQRIWPALNSYVTL